MTISNILFFLGKKKKNKIRRQGNESKKFATAPRRGKYNENHEKIDCEEVQFFGEEFAFN